MFSLLTAISTGISKMREVKYSELGFFLKMDPLFSLLRVEAFQAPWNPLLLLPVIMNYYCYYYSSASSFSSSSDNEPCDDKAITSVAWTSAYWVYGRILY